MTWLDFKNAVRVLISTDQDREGAQEYINAMIRLAVIDIQNYVDVYRIGHEAVYKCQDFATEGYASKGTLPPAAEVRNVWITNISADDNGDPSSAVKHPVRQIDWSLRNDLIMGAECINDQHGVIAIDPYADTFYIYPEVDSCKLVSMFWDGLKLDFEDDEETPFDEVMTEPVAEYVKAKVAREVGKDTQLYDSYMRSYAVARRKLSTIADRRNTVKA